MRSRISIPFIMDNQRLFIANLSKGKLGQDKTALLGSLLVSQFQLAAMARTNQPEDTRRDFFLFVDEFQNFVTEALASVLSEARKYRLCLTLAHQFTDQLTLPLRQAVFGNVGTLVSFRVGYLDAHALHHEFGEGFVPQQFVDLQRYEVFIRLHQDGQTQPAFRASSAASRWGTMCSVKTGASTGWSACAGIGHAKQAGIRPYWKSERIHRHGPAMATSNAERPDVTCHTTRK